MYISVLLSRLPRLNQHDPTAYAASRGPTSGSPYEPSAIAKKLEWVSAPVSMTRHSSCGPDRAVASIQSSGNDAAFSYTQEDQVELAM
jgi:hypothetical protein